MIVILLMEMAVHPIVRLSPYSSAKGSIRVPVTPVFSTATIVLTILPVLLAITCQFGTPLLWPVRQTVQWSSAPPVTLSMLLSFVLAAIMGTPWTVAIMSVWQCVGTA